jgi:tRNA nucleotidyltransferase (CCA-adding enzyme)
LEGFGDPPEPWLLYLGGLALHGELDTITALVERLQPPGMLRDRLLALPEETTTLMAAVDADLANSQLVSMAETRSTEALLLSMAALPLESRRKLATAAETAATVAVPIAGQQLIDAGVPPGPHVGRALAQTRDALIDGVIGSDEALEWALDTARYLLSEEPA